MKPTAHAALLFLLLIAFVLPWQGGMVNVVVALLVLAFAMHGSGRRKAVLRAWLRLRWLLLSLAALALFFTPGAPLLPAFGDWSPSREGVLLLVDRTALLMTLSALAVIFLAAYSREEIVGALRRSLGLLPAKRADALARRMALLLASLTHAEQLLRQRRQVERNWLDALARSLLDVEQGAVPGAGQGPDEGRASS
ncbi:MAG: CbiQ family ECF transporter T component [Gammaproteobacteria bacterium]|nr:CbiQ family ECF transporter T component [Gammaproteobacteria bacterium]